MHRLTVAAAEVTHTVRHNVLGRLAHGQSYHLFRPADVGKSAAQRAAQLAEVAAAVYDGGGAINIRLPLESEHPLVQVMTTAVRKEQVRLLLWRI